MMKYKIKKTVRDVKSKCYKCKKKKSGYGWVMCNYEKQHFVCRSCLYSQYLADVYVDAINAFHG